MHDKFIFSFIHRVYYFFFIFFVLAFLVYIYLYINYPRYQESIQNIFLKQSVQDIDSYSDNIIKKMLTADSNFLNENIFNENLRKKNERLLELLKHENISYIFVVFLKKGKLYYLMDASEREKAVPLEPFIPENMELFNEIQADKTKKIFIQKKIQSLGFTFIKPIIQDNKVVAFLLLDYTQKGLETLFYSLNRILKVGLFVMSGIMILLTFWAVIIGVRLYRKYKMYCIPKTKAYLRSFLADHYERINFLDYYIALIDIDSFRRISDLYGKEGGDLAIKRVLWKISFFLTKEDILIRYGGEEFLLLVCKRNTTSDEFKQKMEEIRSSIESLSIPLNGATEHVTVSIGTLIQSNNASSLQNAIHNADTALYFAKYNGCNRVCDFNLSDEKRTYREKLKDMIESDQLVCHYQPIVNLQSGEVHHYEALLRIKDDEKIIYPDKILPDLEESYFYSRMSMKVIEYNVEKLRSEPKFTLSINLSSDDLLNNAILELLMKHKDVADRMMIEILETKNIDYQSIESVISELKGFGYKICIDDFGTGYANFKHLFSLSVDYLKLDGSLILNLHIDKRMHNIIHAIVDFCQQQEIHVIAEFVENEQIVEILKSLGVMYGQGFFFDKPKPFEALRL